MQQTEKTSGHARDLLLPGFLIAAFLVACEQPVTGGPEPAAPHPVSRCDRSAYLRANLTGGIEANIDWSGNVMQCESMLRPNGAGVRLRFGGAVAGEQLAFIIAMPDLASGDAGREVPSNVTVSVEGSGRFFSTPGLDSCWTDIREQQRLAEDEERYRILGILYCVSPLGELNGNAAVSVSELSFRGIVDWSAN